MYFMKKLFTVLSLAVILSFGITAVIKLTPRQSRDGLSNTDEPVTQDTYTPVVPPMDGDTYIYKSLTLDGTTYKDPVIINGIKIGDISFFIPQVTYSDAPEVADKINSVLKAKAEDHLNNYLEECKFLAMDFDPEEMSPYSYNSSSRLYVSKNTVSVKMTTEIDYGSVLTEKSVFCYNFSIETGEEITLSDTGIDKSALIDAIIEKSLTMSDYEFIPEYQSYIKEHICNSWYIDKKVIYLVYVPFEITAGIHGTVEIAVDLDSIK